MGPFMMSPAKAVVTGFWIFENIQTVFNRNYMVIPLITVSALLLTLMVLLNYHLGNLVHLFVDRKIQRNISKMNDILSDTLHSQKNLLFSINILAQEALQICSSERKEEIIPVKKIFNISEVSIKKNSEMLDSLRAIRYKFKKNDLIEALKEALGKIVLPPDIIISWRSDNYDKKMTSCLFDYYHLSQVFVNILNNAIEAIKLAQREKGVIYIDIATQFQWVFVIIEDNGIGIKKSALKNLFVPYYSGKAGLQNWGLGLSYAYKVIKAHLGYLRVESKYGEDTQFLIMLPKSAK
jgi:signal transduction histidine kinase